MRVAGDARGRDGEAGAHGMGVAGDGMLRGGKEWGGTQVPPCLLATGTAQVWSKLQDLNT